MDNLYQAKQYVYFPLQWECNRTNFDCYSRDIGFAGITSDIEYVELDATVNIHMSSSAAAEAEVDNNDPAKDWQWGVEVASTSISTLHNSKSIIVDEYNILLFFPPNGALLFAGDSFYCKTWVIHLPTIINTRFVKQK